MYDLRQPTGLRKAVLDGDYTPYHQSFDAMFAALANPARRRILHFVGNGMTGPRMLSEHTGVAPSTVCHHLKVLDEAKLIERCPARDCMKVNRNALKALRDYMQRYF